MADKSNQFLKPKTNPLKNSKHTELPSSKLVGCWTTNHEKKTVVLYLMGGDSSIEICPNKEPKTLPFIQTEIMESKLFDTKCKFKLKSGSIGRFQFKMFGETFFIYSDLNNVLSLQQSPHENSFFNIISIIKLQYEDKHFISGLNDRVPFPTIFKFDDSLFCQSISNFKVYHTLKYGYRDEKDPHIIMKESVVELKSNSIKTSWQHIHRVVYLIMPMVMKQSVDYKSKLIDITKVIHYYIDSFGWVHLSSSPLIEKTQFIQVFNIHHLNENKLFFNQLTTLLNIKQVSFNSDSNDQKKSIKKHV